MKQTISSIFIIFTLLFSMTEISKVALMGYTLFTDGEKAAHFCTCLGCSHDTNSSDESSHCSMDMADRNTHKKGGEPKHCDTSQTADGASICGCSSTPSGNLHILFNTIDKTALLANPQYVQKELKRTFLTLTNFESPISIQRDIFHPPRA
jgi:hypothetical protein